ncbi:MAG: hypothetical protein AB1634_13470 [Thermodesulfobacteriota bacterium]
MRPPVDFDEILSKYRQDPYHYVDVHVPHTGRLRFHVEKGTPVKASSGEWGHIPGSLLYVLTREKNPKPFYSPINGEVSFLREDLQGAFVEAREKVIVIKHPLKKREIIESILRQILLPFRAPERARYFFSLEIQGKMDKEVKKPIAIKAGDEILTMSLMKRDIPVLYDGEPGIIHSLYFTPGVTVEQGEPLLGICPPEQLPLIDKIISRVKAEWE